MPAKKETLEPQNIILDCLYITVNEFELQLFFAAFFS